MVRPILGSMSPLANRRIATIGSGVMAESMIAGLLNGRLVGPDQIRASHPRAERRTHLEAEYGVETTASNAEAVEGADIVILAIKPQMLGRVGREIAPYLREDQLVLFLVLFLFYCAYFMLRFSLEEGPRRARSSAVYALFGVVLIPVSFLAIRLAEGLIHPTVFTREGPQMSGSMFATFCVSWVAVTLLAYVLYRVELVGKRLDADLRELREALR